MLWEWQSDLIKDLPVLNTISGCDAANAMDRIGKSKWLSTLEKEVDVVKLLGKGWNWNNPFYYNWENDLSSVWSAWDEKNVKSYMFCRLKTPDFQKLPPIKDELLRHAKWANYQSHIQTHALNSMDGDKEWELVVVWMEHKPVPELMLELITGNDHQSKFGDNCQRYILSLKFTYLCECIGNCKKVFYCDQSKEKKREKRIW